MIKKLETWTYDYRRLAAKYPDSGPDYHIDYFTGDYYSRSTTTYLGHNGEELEVKDNGYYG